MSLRTHTLRTTKHTAEYSTARAPFRTRLSVHCDTRFAAFLIHSQAPCGTRVLASDTSTYGCAESSATCSLLTPSAPRPAVLTHYVRCGPRPFASSFVTARASHACESGVAAIGVDSERLLSRLRVPASRSRAGCAHGHIARLRSLVPYAVHEVAAFVAVRYVRVRRSRALRALTPAAGPLAFR